MYLSVVVLSKVLIPELNLTSWCVLVAWKFCECSVDVGLDVAESCCLWESVLRRCLVNFAAAAAGLCPGCACCWDALGSGFSGSGFCSG